MIVRLGTSWLRAVGYAVHNPRLARRILLPANREQGCDGIALWRCAHHCHGEALGPQAGFALCRRHLGRCLSMCGQETVQQMAGGPRRLGVARECDQNRFEQELMKGHGCHYKS